MHFIHTHAMYKLRKQTRSQIVEVHTDCYEYS